MRSTSPTNAEKLRLHRAGSARRAAALLEVVVAISILLLGMAVVGMAFSNGAIYVERAERLSRTMELTQRLTGELASGITVVGENQASGGFGDAAPRDEAGRELCWHIAVTPADQVPGLVNIEIEIFMGAPDSKPEERQHVLTTYAQQAVFVPLNMQRDFGMTQEQMDLLTQAIPGGKEVFDPAGFDPRSVARLDMDMLKQLLPLLIQAFGGQAVAEHLDDIIKALQTGDTSGLQDLAQQAGKQGTLPGPVPGLTPPPARQPPPPSGRPPQPSRANDVPKRPRTGSGGGKP